MTKVEKTAIFGICFTVFAFKILYFRPNVEKLFTIFCRWRIKVTRFPFL